MGPVPRGVRCRHRQRRVPRIVDLAQPLSPEFPALVLPAEFGQVWAFKQETISRYDEHGPAWYGGHLLVFRTDGSRRIKHPGRGAMAGPARRSWHQRAAR